MKDTLIRNYEDWEQLMLEVGATRFVTPRLKGESDSIYASTPSGKTLGVWRGTFGHAVSEDVIFEDVD